ncbi:MAG: hypothetical protein IJ357_06605 [Oscillospiraceae bacterium]|nr:hypothetical protein [Oscillospiraceae bacterium]
MLELIFLIFSELWLVKLGRLIMGKDWQGLDERVYAIVSIGAIMCPFGVLILALSIDDLIRGDIDALAAVLVGASATVLLIIEAAIIITKRIKLRRAKEAEQQTQTELPS